MEEQILQTNQLKKLENMILIYYLKNVILIKL
jgi:hypothetical protein